MLAYHNSFFLLPVVCLRLRIYWPNFKIDVHPLWSFLLVFLIFPRVSLLNFAILSHLLYEWLPIIGTPVFICFKQNMVLYVSLGGRIYKKTAFHAYLGTMQYCKSFVILIKSALFNWVMYSSFAISFSQVNIHIYDNFCREMGSVGHTKTCTCFSKICKAKIEFSKNIRMTRNSEKKNKQIL